MVIFHSYVSLPKGKSLSDPIFLHFTAWGEVRPPGTLDGGKKRPGGALLRRDLRQDLSVPRRRGLGFGMGFGMAMAAMGRYG